MLCRRSEAAAGIRAAVQPGVLPPPAMHLGDVHRQPRPGLEAEDRWVPGQGSTRPRVSALRWRTPKTGLCSPTKKPSQNSPKWDPAKCSPFAPFSPGHFPVSPKQPHHFGKLGIASSCTRKERRDPCSQIPGFDSRAVLSRSPRRHQQHKEQPRWRARSPPPLTPGGCRAGT